MYITNRDVQGSSTLGGSGVFWPMIVDFFLGGSGGGQFFYDEIRKNPVFALF